MIVAVCVAGADSRWSTEGVGTEPDDLCHPAQERRGGVGGNHRTTCSHSRFSLTCVPTHSVSHGYCRGCKLQSALLTVLLRGACSIWTLNVLHDPGTRHWKVKGKPDLAVSSWPGTLFHPSWEIRDSSVLRRHPDFLACDADK
jgi:hypothetical protein